VAGGGIARLGSMLTMLAVLDGEGEKRQQEMVVARNKKGIITHVPKKLGYIRLCLSLPVPPLPIPIPIPSLSLYNKPSRSETRDGVNCFANNCAGR
jgi:hypothetical protein